MEITLIDGEIYEMEEVRDEAIYKIKSAVEWYYENDGGIIDWEEACEMVDKEMEQEKWIYEATDVFYKECEYAYIEAVEDIENNIMYWKGQKEDEKRDRFNN